MRLSTRARYGLRIAFLLGLSPDKPVSLSTLVKQTDLSEKYLGQLLIMLRRGGVAVSTRGAGGGYVLSKSADEITVKEILTALDDAFDPGDCIGGTCNDDYCPNRTVFRRVYEGIDGILSGITLGDMIRDYKCVR